MKLQVKEKIEIILAQKYRELFIITKKIIRYTFREVSSETVFGRNWNKLVLKSSESQTLHLT